MAVAERDEMEEEMRSMRKSNVRMPKNIYERCTIGEEKNHVNTALITAYYYIDNTCYIFGVPIDCALPIFPFLRYVHLNTRIVMNEREVEKL